MLSHMTVSSQRTRPFVLDCDDAAMTCDANTRATRRATRRSDPGADHAYDLLIVVRVYIYLCDEVLSHMRMPSLRALLFAFGVRARAHAHTHTRGTQ